MQSPLLPAALISIVLAATSTQSLASHAIYQGSIGKSPVTLVIEHTNGVTRGLYSYDRYRTPIRLKPTFLNTPMRKAMDELDPEGLPVARLHFNTTNFYPNTPLISGTWTDYRSGRSLPMTLKPQGFLEDFLRDENSGTQTHSLLQAESSERFYFQIPMMLSYDAIGAIEVMDKATGKRVQVLALSLPNICNRGINTVRVEQQDEHLQVHVDKGRHCAGASFKWNDTERRFMQL
ncbi:hypothetical protein [Ectopseudomonas alcaliphila]|uniref:hypothetical protein n=1 Tax=Ectopseudomonas alcaliphila TaxID=101564 RepID=UPI0027803CC8|nr:MULTISPECIES: hypothetical protein [Pseudomonas]MDP9940846.1 hypothetical protein [Pseudomonas sp. 3400]MDR7011589.1 hypothetical protein [Pseudomonas alcaliphila]